MDTLTTERLHLRRHTLDDAEVMHRLNQDPRVTRYTFDDPITLERMRELIERITFKDYAVFGFGRMVVVLRETGEAIGMCGLKRLDDGEVDLGYRLHPDHWGKGLATEASRACLDWGFREIDVSRIVATVHPDNGGSVRVLEKVGMVCVGEVVEEEGVFLGFEVRREDWGR